MKRCSRCILPEGMPGIKFDSDGICNYCRSYKRMEAKGEEALEKIFFKYRDYKDSKYDCLMTFSGGRDSSYVLYQLVKKHKLRTICLTIDCGLITEYACRNMERAKKILGVEHIIIKTNPDKILKHVGQNIKAWIKKPSLVMIPLFMMGDKTSHKVMIDFARERNIPLVISGGASGIEDGVFKAGFAGVPKEPYNFNRFDAFVMALHYLSEYLKNPGYLNGSLLYTLKGWFEFFFLRYPYTGEWLHYFQYIKWNEAKVLKTIREELGWETPPDTIQTWRTDDATSPWYNFLYYSMTGFTENDELLSNMIREGIITREGALVRVEKENQPRYKEIEKYLKMVNVDIDIYQLEKKLNCYRKTI